MKRTLRKAFARFASDETGSLTMEFMLWLPVLMFWLIFSLVLYDAYDSRKDAALAGYTLADILSRQVEIDDETLEDVVKLQRALLPRAARGMWLRVSSIKCTKDEPEDDCVFSVEWSVVPEHEEWLDDFLPPVRLKDEDIPADKVPSMADQDQVLYIELKVPFKPISDAVRIQATEWSFDLFTRPRYVTAVKLSASGVNS